MPGASIAADAVFDRRSRLPATRSISRGRQAARPQQPQFVALDLDDGRFDADGARARIEDQLDLVAEIGVDMCGAGGADPAGCVGARCGERPAEGADQLARKPLRHPDADRIETGGCQRMDRAFRLQAAGPASAAPARRLRPVRARPDRTPHIPRPSQDPPYGRSAD